MWYTLPDSTKQYPLTIERVRKIKQLNERNQVPDELEAVDVTTQKPKEVEPEFVDVVGQISLRSLERAEKKKRHHHHHQNQNQHQNQQKEQQPRQQQQQHHRRDNRPPAKKDDRRNPPKNNK
jgi:hypothetical protein